MVAVTIDQILSRDPAVPLCFASIGECMVELAPIAQPGQFQMAFAGDTFNTAWYLKKLQPEWVSRYVTCVGTDAVSDAMVAMMGQAGIETGHIGRIADRSVGLYLISLANGERSFSYWRDSSAAKLLARDRAMLDAAIDGADIAYFSGISLAILDEAGRKTLLDAVRDARAAGKITAFDSNLRPRLWSDKDTMTRAIMQAAEVSDIVLPSYDDEAVHFGDADPDATRDRYLAVGAKTVVVKNGPGVIHFAHEGRTGQVSPPAVSAIVDTTAAGDSFNAGFFAGLGLCGSIEDAILLASNVAGQVIGQRGGLVPIDRGGLTAGGSAQ